MLILERAGGTRVLRSRGRDAPEFDVEVSMDDHCRWSVVGPAPEDGSTPERLKIIAAMRKIGRPCAAPEVAAAIGEPLTNVQKMLSRLHGVGEIEKAGHGLYRLPEGVLAGSDKLPF